MLSGLRFCEVVFNRPLKRSFTYSIPPGFRDSVKIGQRVRVSFGKSDAVGYVVELSKNTPPEIPAQVKEVKDIIDKEPVVGEDMLELARWMSHYYFCSLGEALSLFFPGGWRKAGKITSLRPDKRQDVYPKEVSSHPFLPTPDQNKSIERIKDALEKREKKVFLLHGVTASGKTEVYLQLSAWVRAMAGSVIVLVPEIVLTHEILRSFEARFGADVAVWHSKLRGLKRYREWSRVREGNARIVIGPRSAIFSPVKDLRLVIVDEEHENSYKESQKSPRYHGRDVAIMRAHLSNGITLLGSATPSLESYYNALKNKYELIELPTRVDLRKLPEVKIIDLRKTSKDAFFSEDLKEAIGERLARKEQVILFLNRRGFSYFVICQACGYVFRCKNCKVSLTYHRKKDRGLCHYCGYSERIGAKCPECKNEALRFMGAGTEKVEEEAKSIFPKARVRRLDSDVTARKGAITSVLKDLRARRIDILVGTQMAAKGLDFPHVTLIGVILADGGLNVPDFRAGERTFQLLTQVAGRSGRGREPGVCIVQTYNPGHYTITASAGHDYQGFFNEEIKFREQLYYPPLCRFIRVIVRGTSETKVREGIERLADAVRKKLRSGTVLTGPSPAPLPRLKRKYRWQFCVKTKNISLSQDAIRSSLEEGKTYLKNLEIIVDTDPLDMY